MSGDIPCGPRDGFLYPGACSDMCGEPYSCEGDPRTGHECCSTVASIYSDLYAALDDVLTTIRIEVEAKGGTKRQALARIEVAEIRARAALRRARGGS